MPRSENRLAVISNPLSHRLAPGEYDSHRHADQHDRMNAADTDNLSAGRKTGMTGTGDSANSELAGVPDDEFVPAAQK